MFVVCLVRALFSILLLFSVWIWLLMNTNKCWQSLFCLVNGQRFMSWQPSGTFLALASCHMQKIAIFFLAMLAKIIRSPPRSIAFNLLNVCCKTFSKFSFESLLCVILQLFLSGECQWSSGCCRCCRCCRCFCCKCSVTSLLLCFRLI